MKPVKLTIENFGPFADTQVIDFTQLDDIFLISGKTGSGKTSIFDAMCYALYGELPGTRDETKIKSTYTEETGTAAVTFEFKVNAKAFKIERSLDVKRTKKGDINYVKKQTVFIHKRGKFVPDTPGGQVNEVKDYIHNLLHFTKEEFSKVILLPQGEFQRFLEADSRERQAIMQKLFPTAEHRSITEVLKRKKLDARENIKNTQRDIEELQADFDIENYKENLKKSETEIGITEKSKKKAEAEYEKIIEKLTREQSLLEKFEEKEKAEVREKKLKAQAAATGKKKSYVEQADKASRLLPYIKTLEELDEKIKTDNEKFENLKKQTEELNKRRGKLDEKLKQKPKLEKEKTDLVSENGSLEPLIKKESQLAGKTDELTALKESVKESEEAFKKVEQNQKDLKKQYKDIKEEIKKLNEVLEPAKKVREQNNRLERLLKLLHDTATAEKNLEQASKNLDEYSKTSAINKQQYEELLSKKEAAQAANLAAGLEKDKPCPVCGSLEHPVPADEKTEPFTDEEKLEAAFNNLKNSEKDEATAEADIKQYKTQIRKLEEEKGEYKTENIKTIKECESKLKEIRVSLQAIEKSENKYDQLREQADEIEKKLDSISEEVQEKSARVEKMQRQLSALKSEVDSLLKDLAGKKDIEKTHTANLNRINEISEQLETIVEEEKQLEKAITTNTSETRQTENVLKENKARYSEESDSLKKKSEKEGFKTIKEVKEALLDEEEIENLKTEIEKYEEEVRTTGYLLESLKKETGKTRKPDTGLTEKEKEKIAATIDQADEKLKELNIALDTLKKQKARHDTLEKKLEKLTTDNAVLFELSEDLEGYKKDKINFETFVLQYYLHKVTFYANERLALLSNGRYALKVNREKTKGGGRSGLELEVDDAHTGIARSVKSLSGGEKFLASISLALGLTDAIQERAGRIEMDSLFIDEGFGTLDEETLDRAMGILDEIKDNRVVGIISHVSELRNRIHCRLQVEKSDSGSKVYTRC